MRKEIIDIDRLSIQFYLSGNQDSENGVVFIHGNALSGMCFKHQLENKLLNSNKLIVFDLPGCGNTPYDKENHSLLYIVELLEKIIKYFRLKGVCLVGHSLGGHIAFAALQKLTSINGFFVFGAPPLRSLNDFENAFNMNLSEFYKANLDEGYLDSVSNLICTKEKNRRFIKELIIQSSGGAREQLFKSIPSVFQNEVEIVNSAKELNCFIGHSTNESIVNQRYIEALDIKNLWGNSIYFFKYHSHSPQLDSPNEFNKILSCYLKHCFDQKSKPTDIHLHTR